MSEIFHTGMVFTVSLIGTFYIIDRFKKYQKFKGMNFPPCVKTVPFLGSLPFLPPFPKMYGYFTDNMQRYGGVVGYYMLGEFNVILNGKEAIQEAFVKKGTDFASRPGAAVNNILNPNQKGIMFHPYNENFSHYHQVSLSIFKLFGFGSKLMESLIAIEIESLIERLKKTKGKVFHPTSTLANCSMNIICSILFGKRFDDDNPALQDIIKSIRKSFENLGKIFILNILPFARYIPHFNKYMTNCKNAQDGIFKMLEEKIVECLNPDAPENFISHYIEKEGPSYDKEQLLHFMHELFLAGTDTTTSTLEWTLVLLANNPRVQKKMWTELDSNISRERLPMLDDKSKLIYCEAVFCEILRSYSVAPLTLPHMTLRDTNIFGYDIPAQTMVIANLHSVHYNKDTWGDPEVFRPERFIDEKTGSLINKEHIIAFSLGKRACFGEIMARQEFFLALTAIAQNFEILPPIGKDKIDVTIAMDVTAKPTYFEVRLVERPELN